VQLATQRAERLKAAWDEVPAMDAKRPELIFEYLFEYRYNHTCIYIYMYIYIYVYYI